MYTQYIPFWMDNGVARTTPRTDLRHTRGGDVMALQRNAWVNSNLQCAGQNTPPNHCTLLVGKSSEVSGELEAD